MTVIEVLIGAVIIVVISLGALNAMDAASRTAAEERHRSQAHGIAQADQARLRSMRITDLSNLNQTTTVNEGGTPYTVDSRGEFITDSTGTATCTPGTASADYIKISSTISWPSMGNRPPVLITGVVTPPNGSVAPDRGTLAVQVDNAANTGISGVGLSGAGPSTFSGNTGSSGCVIFGNLPAGNYVLTPSASSSLVDRDGSQPAAQNTSVIASATNTLALQYDTPGAIEVDFTTKVGSSVVPSSADSIVVFNTGMTEAKAFGDPGSPSASITATPLFPFSSPDTVYAGACTSNNPNPDNLENPPAQLAMANVTVTPGGTSHATIQLPALNLRVMSGVGAILPGLPVVSATVKITGQDCDWNGQPIVRIYHTNAGGKLPDPGLPYGVYDVCIEASIGPLGVHLTINDIGVTDPLQPTPLDIYLGGTGVGTGPCP